MLLQEQINFFKKGGGRGEGDFWLLQRGTCPRLAGGQLFAAKIPVCTGAKGLWGVEAGGVSSPHPFGCGIKMLGGIRGDTGDTRGSQLTPAAI